MTFDPDKFGDDISRIGGEIAHNARDIAEALEAQGVEFTDPFLPFSIYLAENETGLTSQLYQLIKGYEAEAVELLATTYAQRQIIADLTGALCGLCAGFVDEEVLDDLGISFVREKVYLPESEEQDDE